MVTGTGWWAMPWLIPAALVVVCLVIVGIFGYLARELLFTGRRDAADEAELRAAQRWLNQVRDERRYEDPAAAWASFLAGERERLAVDTDDVDPDPGDVDGGEDLAELIDEDPDPEPRCWCGRDMGHIFAAAVAGADVDAEFATAQFEAVS